MQFNYQQSFTTCQNTFWNPFFHIIIIISATCINSHHCFISVSYVPLLIKMIQIHALSNHLKRSIRLLSCLVFGNLFIVTILVLDDLNWLLYVSTNHSTARLAVQLTVQNQIILSTKLPSLRRIPSSMDGFLFLCSVFILRGRNYSFA